MQFAGEVRLELLDGVGERRVVGVPAVTARLIGLVDHPQMHQPAVLAGQGQRSDRAVDRIETAVVAITSPSVGQSLTAWSSAVHRCWVA